MPSEQDYALCVTFYSKEKVIIRGERIAADSIDFEQTVNANEWGEQQTIAAVIETFEHVVPENPIAKYKQHRHADTDGSKFAQKQVKEKVHRHAIDENVSFFAALAQLVDIAKQEDARNKPFQIANRQNWAAHIEFHIFFYPQLCWWYNQACDKRYKRLENRNVQKINGINHDENGD